MIDNTYCRARRGILAALVGGGVLLALGCTPEIGEVELVSAVNDELFIALVADDETIAVYACDGTESSEDEPIYEWLIGENVDGEFDIVTPKVSISGTFDRDGSVSGTVTTYEGDYPYTATTASGDEGMYYAEEGDYKGGWVVIGDDARGAVINRLQGGLAVGASFTPSLSTVMFQGITFTPFKQTIVDYQAP